MTQYILKRLLLMVPTFLMITLLVFVIVNLAPGEPGQAASAGGSESADQSANARESHRLFKEQYNLDKPVLLNFRFLLDVADVMDELEVVAANMTSALPGERVALGVGLSASRVLSAIHNRAYYDIERQLAAPGVDEETQRRLERERLNVGFVQLEPLRPQRPPQGRVFRAEENLENWGQTIVPFLIEIASSYVYLIPDGLGARREEGRGLLLRDLPGGSIPDAGVVQLDGASWRVHPIMTEKVRFLAVQRLSVNARRRLVVRDGERPTPDQAALNREIVQENNRMARWVYPLDAGPEVKAEALAAWVGWFQENQGRYERSGASTVREVFLDTRFAKYWGNLARLDLGTSIRYRRPVLDVIGDHWRYSIYLSLMSLFLAYLISVPIGILAAVKQNTFADRGIGIFLFVLYSLPSFFVATLAQSYLTRANGLDIFPVSGFQSVDPLQVTTWDWMLNILWHMVLPVFCLTYTALAVLSRYARSGLLDVIRSDYIRTARAKGLSEWVVILKHAVRNGMIPILTLLGTTLPVLIGGSIIIEFIFVIDGMGRLMIQSILFRDYNVIMGILLISSILTLIGILLSDISYALVDPRISFD